MYPVPMHFYHLWLSGEWQHIAQWHLDHLRNSEFDGQVFVGLVGDPEVRAAARALLPWHVVAEAEVGFEDVTLRELLRVARTLPGSTPVLYAHNKGSFHNLPENRLWRLYMTEYLVDAWRSRVLDLETHDVAAWRWILKGTPDPNGNLIQNPHASGNFWWARADYLKGLPELPALTEATRIEAEWWIGSDEPCTAFASSDWPRMYFKVNLGGGASGGMRQPDRWVPNPDFYRC